MKSTIFITASLCLITFFSSAQTVFDDFERSGGLGSNWTVFFGGGSVDIVYDSDLGFTNNSALFGIAAWTATTLTADQYSEAVISPNRIDSMLTQVFVRRRTSDNARYGFHWNNDFGGRWEIKYDGVPTIQTRILASLPGAEPLAGDTIRLEIQVMTLKGFHNGNLLLTYTDSAFAASSPITTTGAPGMAYRFTVGFAAFYPQQVFEEWGAGNLATTSINENTTENNFLMFPNPASQQLNTTCNNFSSAQLFSPDGKIVLQTKQKAIDVSSIPDGIYFLKIFSNGYYFMRKVIIQH